ncbi:MAG: chromosomal replication initiator protein DnaA [Bifidobacteriaceae bacterium]|nr:chromosomal replication initiator protein DnaA [Bifidobacteriaceae bacterium]
MNDPRNVDQLWSAAVDALVSSGRIMGQAHGFLQLVTPRGLAGDIALLAVDNDYAKDFLETQLRDPLTEALSAVAGRAINFAVTVDPSLSTSLPPEPAAAEPAPVLPPTPQPPGIHHHSHLQPRYTFESFVVGPSNRFAAAAARAVAESPAKTYNPLFIYGGSGLGKTHLIHAIGNYALTLDPGLKILYTTSEEFANDFINCVQVGQMEAFKHRYRSNNILLIDDIQFLTGKGQTMEEFFHTFNTLYNSGSHIVITSDTPPKQLNGFQDRLTSRFEGGLQTDVLPPELETRIAILRQKAASEGIKAPDDVLEYIASRVSSNIRELEGALIRVTAFANLNSQAVDLPLAEIVLRDLITDHETEITPSLIIGQTAQYFSLTLEDISGPSRNRNLVEARQIAMYLCRELTDLSLPSIGREFGGRDHTTVLHACNKVKATLPEKQALYNKIAELTYRIKQHAKS